MTSKRRRVLECIHELKEARRELGIEVIAAVEASPEDAVTVIDEHELDAVLEVGDGFLEDEHPRLTMMAVRYTLTFSWKEGEPVTVESVTIGDTLGVNTDGSDENRYGMYYTKVSAAMEDSVRAEVTSLVEKNKQEMTQQRIKYETRHGKTSIDSIKLFARDTFLVHNAYLMANAPNHSRVLDATTGSEE